MTPRDKVLMPDDWHEAVHRLIARLSGQNRLPEAVRGAAGVTGARKLRPQTKYWDPTDGMDTPGARDGAGDVLKDAALLNPLRSTGGSSVTAMPANLPVRSRYHPSAFVR
jgi:hypothetical protein